MSTQTLPTRQLGKDGPQVTAIGFGLMGLSSFYGKVGSDEERFKILDRAYELGETFWDSADMYGDSEDLVGKWFARTGKRNDIFLATKFANVTRDGQWAVDSSPEYCKEACAKSLKRLGIDCIDLYYCHRIDQTTPIEHTMKAMVELKNEGKIKYIGLSEVSEACLRRAYKIHPVHCVQMEYSPFSLEVEQFGLLKACRELGVAMVAYSPLSRGILTGQIKSPEDFEADDFRRYSPRFSQENFAKNLEAVDAMKAFADRKGCTVGQLSLAWLLAQGPEVIPIPGTKKIKYLEENLGALKVNLSDEEEGEIRKVLEKTTVAGDRYPSAWLSGLFADSAPL
ncbi:hypothetical protein QFC24_001821 [Naganishia onofrii]|uniref:Uncharacterized protein n=1 Tax=Naganishia onofrii TaxID=1851511 RepID=A0ACC2XRY3_9TREE|nr:hypothetical protein QFC24_001821 [Naganishia onofrii]